MKNRLVVSRSEYDQALAEIVRLSEEKDDLLERVDECEQLNWDLDHEADEYLQENARLKQQLRDRAKQAVTKAEYDDLAAAKCIHCGGVHSIACPRVKRIRFRADGQTALEVEFFAEWPKDDVLWIEDVYVAPE